MLQVPGELIVAVHACLWYPGLEQREQGHRQPEQLHPGGEVTSRHGEMEPGTMHPRFAVWFLDRWITLGWGCQLFVDVISLFSLIMVALSRNYNRQVHVALTWVVGGWFNSD